MVLGRAIERVDMTVRLLLARVGDSASSPAWVTVLRSAGAHDTYLRTYRGVLDASPRGRIHAAGPAVPAVGDVLAAAGRAQPRRTAPPRAQPYRRHRTRRSDCWAAPAASWSSCAPACCWSLWSNASPGCRRRARRRRSVGVGVLSLRAVGGVDGCGPMARWSSRKAKSDVAVESRALHRLCLQVTGDGILQRGAADPTSDSRQNVILNRVETMPATRSYRYVDYWGTAVTAFDLHAPHTELEVTSSSVVETDRGEYAEGEGDLGGPAVLGGDRPVRRGTSVRRSTRRTASGSPGSGNASPSTTSRERPSSRRRTGCTANWSTFRAPRACTRPGSTRTAKARASARTSLT